MNFLKYSNETQSNIIPETEFKELVQETFNILANNITKCLGPLGSSATILNGMMTEATKDGYSILSKYNFRNRYKKMVYNLILAPCTKMNNIVGDGTTTAIVLTSELFNAYTDRRAKLETLYRLPRDFVKAWDEVIDDIIDKVKNKAKPIDPEDYDTIYSIAYVTSNGNAEISKNIADTYKSTKSPAIRQKDSPTNKSYISQIDGFDFPANLIDDAFVRNEDLSAEEKDISVIVFDHKIETDVFKALIDPINQVMKSKSKKLLLLAPAYDAYMADTILNQYVVSEFRHGGINLIMAQYNSAKLKKHQLSDLCTILRTKFITQDMAENMIKEIQENGVDMLIENIEHDNENYPFYRCIGKSSKALLSCNSGCIFKVDNIEDDKHYQEVLAHAKRDLEEIKAQTDYEKQSFASKIYDANSRVLQLEMKNFIYYIGADSALQKQILEAAIDDVIKCVRSSIQSGTVPGCQLTIIEAATEVLAELYNGRENLDNATSEEKLKAELITMIQEAVINVYVRVLHGPNNMGVIKLIPRWQYTNDEGVPALQEEARKKAQEIVLESIERQQVFDLETLEYNPNIITSAETDTLVLSAASELIKILISGNQCIFLDTEINDNHEEEIASSFADL